MATDSVDNGRATTGGARDGVAVITVASSKEGNGDERRSTATRMSGSRGSQGKLTVGRMSIASLAADFLIILCIGLVVLVLVVGVEPYHRGFFCEDDSIRLPWKEDTVSTLVLLFVGISIPVGTVIGCEAVAARRMGPAGRARRVAVARFTLAAWTVRVFYTITLFIFGLAAEEIIVESAKFSVGRLRPHFLDVCKPSPSVGDLCGNATLKTPDGVFPVPFASWSPHNYITDFECTGRVSVVLQARLSFPSGHSSLSFYAAIFTVLYLHRRFRWKRRVRIHVAFVQLVVLVLAWLCALSRIADHKHHWSDVLAGGLIGGTTAALTVLAAVLPSSPATRGDDDAVEGVSVLEAAGDAPPALRNAPSCDTYETLFVI